MLKKYKYTIVASLLVTLGIHLVAYAAGPIFRQFTSKSGAQHIQWQFKHDGTGNAGEVSFIHPGTQAGKDGYFLTGTFWIETIGTATFAPGTMLVAPTTRLDDPWTINGSIDSLAGKIYLTGVLYLPNENILVWSGWNNGIGYVPFGSGSLGSVASVTNTGIAQGFVGKVKILGTLGGNNAFDTFYSVGTRYNASLMNETLNRIKKNVSLLTRNMKPAFANLMNNNSPTVLGNKIFYINTTNAPQLRSTNGIAGYPSTSVDSFIVIGWDILIDADIIELVGNKYPKGIISLKNDKWVGWNIYISPDVKNIESSIFAEGTIYSGTGSANIANATIQQVASLPENQLYIKGSIMSRNTIGGAVQDTNAVCPYNEQACSYEYAIRFDLNYFRNYLSGGTIATTLAYPDNSYDNYSVIIEHDQRISTNPPPGFETK